VSYLIDPPGPFDPTPQWREFLERLMSLPQDDPGVQAELHHAQSVLQDRESQEKT